MQYRDGLSLAKDVRAEVLGVCEMLSHTPSLNTGEATKWQRGCMDNDPRSYAKNQLNFAMAYARNAIMRDNVTADQVVIWANQAHGCLENAKGWITK